QHMRPAGREFEAWIVERAARGRKATAETVKRPIIVGIVGIELRRGAIAIRGRSTQHDCARVPRQEDKRRKTRRAESSAARRRELPVAERLLDKSPRQIGD